MSTRSNVISSAAIFISVLSVGASVYSARMNQEIDDRRYMSERREEKRCMEDPHGQWVIHIPGGPEFCWRHAGEPSQKYDIRRNQ